ETITPSKEPVSPLNLLTPTKSEEAKSSLKMAAPETPLKEPPTTKRESLSETEEVKKTEETQIPQAEFIDTSFVAPPPEQKSIETPSTVEEEKTIEEPSATASLLKEGEKEKEKEEEAEEVFVPPDTTHAIVEGPPLLQTDTPSYAHLNPEVFELFERMIGYMVIEETKGIAITTVKLSMPGSVFNDCEIKLEHYDTAPSSFNIQLSGNPEAVDLFNASFSDLAAAFAQSNYAFDVHLRRPILSTEHRHLIQRKDRVVGDESSKKENAG
ncbi:MAG TPA: hypothetical protein VJK48_02750, partial [Chlamydiales bacterium]|nr:hypothetical protein [Chlamydiales bacterium]